MTRQASATSFASPGRITIRSRHRPQRGELLDRLVRGPVLADADRVVREDVDDRQLHQGAEPDGAARRSR